MQQWLWSEPPKYKSLAYFFFSSFSKIEWASKLYNAKRYVIHKLSKNVIVIFLGRVLQHIWLQIVSVLTLIHNVSVVQIETLWPSCSGGFGGVRGVHKCTPFWRQVMYFCLHNCTSPSKYYAAVACSNNQAQLHPHVSVPYWSPDVWLGLEIFSLDLVRTEAT